MNAPTTARQQAAAKPMSVLDRLLLKTSAMENAWDRMAEAALHHDNAAFDVASREFNMISNEGNG